MKATVIAIISLFVGSIASADLCFKTEMRTSALKSVYCFAGYGLKANGTKQELVLRSFDGRKDLILSVTSFASCVDRAVQGECIGQLKASAQFINQSGACDRVVKASLNLTLDLDTLAYQAMVDRSDLSSVSEIQSMIIDGYTQVDSCHSPKKPFQAVYSRQ